MATDLVKHRPTDLVPLAEARDRTPLGISGQFAIAHRTSAGTWLKSMPNPTPAPSAHDVVRLTVHLSRAAGPAAWRASPSGPVRDDRTVVA